MPRSMSSGIIDRDAALRILIIRLGAIGDVLMTSSVAAALHEHFPNCRVTWLVEPLAAPIVRANPYVDDVIVFDTKKEWVRLLKSGRWGLLWRTVRAFAVMLHERRFDVAIDFQELFKSGFLTWISGAPRRIGAVPSREFNHLFMNEQVERPANSTFLAQANLALLSALGVPVSYRRLVLEPALEDRLAARDFLASRGLVGTGYAACCLSSSRPQKDWVWSRWGELADALREQEGLRTVFIGGPERRVDALSLAEGCASEPISAAGELSLLQSAALVQEAELVVGLDTGLTYAGLACDVPTVAIYGSTESTWLAEEPCATVCFHPMPCSPCARKPVCQHYDCMAAVTVDEVLDAAKRVRRRVLAGV